MNTKALDGSSDTGGDDDEGEIPRDQEEIEPSNQYEYDINSFDIVKGDTTNYQ